MTSHPHPQKPIFHTWLEVACVYRGLFFFFLIKYCFAV